MGFGRNNRNGRGQEGKEARRVWVKRVMVDMGRNGWIPEPGHVLIVE